MSMNYRHALAWIVIACAAASGPARAQDAAAGWHFLAEPYVMFPNMNGDVGLGNLPPAHIDEGPDDIFSNLQMGAMLYLEAHNERWAFSSDVLYMDLGADIPSGTLITGGDAGAKQLGWEVAALARLTPWFELGVAATYNRIDSDLRIDTVTNSTLRASLTEDWIDPSVVARATLPFGEKWFFQGRANLGGFGAGSDLFWQIQADVGYRHSQRLFFTFGYRYISIDYDHGSGANRFIYDVDSFGPTLKFGFNF
ncbi:MAG TPA: hypothetical protein VKB34_06565 [Povalibacter sp.]|nr:hypothetical protein [Povalibacter sp.]